MADTKISPDGKAVAIRTIYPDIEDFADRQWGVMTVNNGGHYETHAGVADWTDLVAVETPAEPESEQ